MTASIKVPAPAAHRVHPVGGYRARRYPVSDGAPVEVVESGPSIQARLTSLSLRLSFRPVLSVLSHVPHLPWPFGLVDFVARALLPSPGTVRATVGLPNASAQLVRAPGVLPADGKRRVIKDARGRVARRSGERYDEPVRGCEGEQERVQVRWDDVRPHGDERVRDRGQRLPCAYLRPRRFPIKKDHSGAYQLRFFR